VDNDAYSLDKLRDIVVPDPPPFWPPAAGVWVVLGLAAAVILFAALRLHAARKRNAYRRAGLALLANARSSHAISVLLKRVALAAFPREKVASLYGRDWVVFLNGSCEHCDFATLINGSIGGGSDLEQLRDAAHRWIRFHSSAH
jgi:hypothetical protein